MIRILRSSLKRFLFNSNKTIPILARTMAMKNLKTLTQEEKSIFANSFDTIFTDCDGVLWLGSKVIQGAPEVINGFKKQGKNVFYFTNNSLKTPESLSAKFKNLGFDSTKEEVLCTSMLTAEYLRLKKFDKTAYVVASSAVKSELDRVGIKNIGQGPDVLTGELNDVKESVTLDPSVGAVIVGYDVHFSYLKLSKAAGYLSSPDVDFIATNTDERFPVPGGRLVPGAGSFVKSVETATGRTPTIIGKPTKFAFDYVQGIKSVDPKRTIMIGDRANTDIAFGKKSGMKTLLVLTGIEKLDDINCYIQQGNDDLVPDYYVDSIGDMLEILELAEKKA